MISRSRRKLIAGDLLALGCLISIGVLVYEVLKIKGPAKGHPVVWFFLVDGSFGIFAIIWLADRYGSILIKAKNKGIIP
jgi:hypothetical protein